MEVTTLSPKDGISETNPLIVNFCLEEALQLQWTVAQMRSATTRCIWVEATLDRDGFAARGFTRSLRKETFSVEVRLILFDEAWNEAARHAIIQGLSHTPNLENELFVDRQGFINVPRLVPVLLPPPPDQLPSTRWILREDTQTEPFASQKIPLGFVLVRIVSLTPSEGGLRGFAGFIENQGASTWRIGDRVFGIYDGPLSNCALIHQGRLAPIRDPEEAHFYADSVLPLIVASASLGIGSISNITRLNGRRIGLTEGGIISTQLHRILSILGASVSIISRSESVHTLSLISSSDIILSGYTDAEDIQFIKSALRDTAVSFFWNSSRGGVQQAVDLNPWLVEDTLRAAASIIRLSSAGTVPLARKPEEFLGHSHVHLSHYLFDSSKAYLLVGGIGSLGLHMALWMYEV